MKNKILIIATAILFSGSALAQKDEMKAAEKALKNGNPVEAQTLLNGATALITNATSAEKAQYQFIKGNICNELANKNTDVANNQIAAGKAYAEVISLEKATGKVKFTDDAKKSLALVKEKLLNSAAENEKSKNYLESSKILKSVYDFDGGLDILYYAANDAYYANNHEVALQYFQELNSKNFTGEATNYFAKNVLTEKEDYFGNDEAAKNDRDSRVKLKVYSNPRDEKTASKKADILKSIANSCSQLGKIEETKAAFQAAIAFSPDDTSLLTDFADFYYFKLKDEVNYKKYVSMAVDKNPNDATLNYNLGVVSLKANQVIEAEKFFKKAIEIKPDYGDAYLNLAQIKVDAQQKFATEMAKLTTSEKDTKRYNFLNTECKKLINEALPNLEKAYELSENKSDVGAQLVSVYKYLDMMDKAKALKAKL